MKTMYAGIPDRIKAAVIDGIILIILMYLTSEVLALFETVSQTVRILLFCLLFIVYEPFFVSFFGGTIGHSKASITVRKESDFTSKIPIHQAIVRFVLKLTLGWISLLTITGSEKRMAIHDLAVSSVVIKEE